MKYLVAIMVPEPDRTALLALQRENRPKAWRITLDPHITLLPPSHALMEPAEAIAAFAKAAPSIDLDIVASKLGQFNSDHDNVIYLEAQPTEQLRQLSQRLYKIVSWQSTAAADWPEFTPHITLANHVPREELTATMETMIKVAPKTQFRANELTLLAKEPRWPTWRVLAG